MPTAATLAVPRCTPDCAGPAPGAATPPSGADLAEHRSALVRFAQRKLLDPCLAEDVVHDVFEAVLSGRARFAGRCALRSWLTAILKHKIVDLVRQRAPFSSLDAAACDEESDAPDAQLACPRPRPDEVAEQRERLAHTLAGIDALPHPLREVLTRRVFLDEPTEKVCAALAISEQNLFVRLHRARKHLLS